MDGKLTRRRVGVITGAVIGKIADPAGISGTATRLQRLPSCRLIKETIRAIGIHDKLIVSECFSSTITGTRPAIP